MSLDAELQRWLESVVIAAQSGNVHLPMEFHLIRHDVGEGKQPIYDVIGFDTLIGNQHVDGLPPPCKENADTLERMRLIRRMGGLKYRVNHEKVIEYIKRRN